MSAIPPPEKSRPGTTTEPYWCFISYRHADNKQEGRQWATWLHQCIETYEVPADLVGIVNDRGDVIPQRIFPVFRDEDELPADAELSTAIYSALDRSRFMLVLCSPQAVASTYVNDEIRYFKWKRGGDRIIAAMLEGEPNASWDQGKLASGIPAVWECFPLTLQHPVDENGELVPGKRLEPIAADFRIGESGEQGWTTPEAYRRALVSGGQLKGKSLDAKVAAYRQRCDLAKLKIIAGILGIPLGRLTKRDAAYQLAAARRRAKMLRLWLVAVGSMALFAVAGGLVAWQQKEIATAQEQEANVQRDKAKLHAGEVMKANERIRSQLRQAGVADWTRARELLENEAQWREGVAYLGRSLKNDPENRFSRTWLWSEAVYGWGSKYVPTHRDVLPELPPPAAVDAWAHLRSWLGNVSVLGEAAHDDGSTILTTDGGVLKIWNTSTRQLAGPPIGPLPNASSALLDSTGTRVLTFTPDDPERFTTLGEAILWNVGTGAPVGAPLRHGVADPEIVGKILDSDPSVPGLFGSLKDRALIPDSTKVGGARFSPDGSRVMTVSKGEEARLWDTATGNPVGAPLRMEHKLENCYFSPDSSHVLTTSGETAQWWRTSTGIPAGPLLTGPAYAGKITFNDAITSEHLTGICIRKEHHLLYHFEIPWDPESAAPPPIELPMSALMAADHAEFGAGGTKLMAQSESGFVRVWQLWPFELIGTRHVSGRVGFSKDGDFLSSPEGVWLIGSDHPRPERLLHRHPVRHLEYRAEEDRLLAVTLDKCSYRGEFAGWDPATLKRKGRQNSHNFSLPTVIFTEDRGKALLLSSGEPCRGFLYDFRESKWIGELSALSGAPERAAFTKDGRQILTSGPAGNQIWDATTAQKLSVPDPDPETLAPDLPPPSGEITDPGGAWQFRCGYIPQFVDPASGLPLTSNLRFWNTPGGALPSPDGKRMMTIGTYGNESTVIFWEIPRDPGEPPLWLQTFVEAVSGRYFDSLGELKTHPIARRVELRTAIMAALDSGNPAYDSWERLARWVFSPANEMRLGLPGGTLTLQELDAIELDQKAVMDGTHPEIKETELWIPDVDHWLRESDRLVKGGFHEAALEAAGRALALDGNLVDARRVVSLSLQRLARIDESFEAYKALHALPDALPQDFWNAGYMAALMGWKDRSLECFSKAEERFPGNHDLIRLKGWSLIDLEAPQEALEAFRQSEKVAVENGKEPIANLVAGFTVARWMSGDQEAAVKDCLRLITMNAMYGDPAKVETLPWSPLEKEQFTAVLTETLRRHPR